MAEMMDKGGRGKKKGGGSKQNKKSTRIDMTAMVDVAFLLLTFFILTTTMASKGMMQLNVPPKETKENKDDLNQDIKESKMLTIILGKKDKLHYYHGITDPVIKTTDYSADGIRRVIRKHLYKKGMERCVGKETKDCWDPIIVIKPFHKSKYKNLVDILDEMSISDARKYALTKLTAVDSSLLIENYLW